MNSQTFYREVERLKVLASIKEWVEEFPQEWRAQRRKEYLAKEIKICTRYFEHLCKELAGRTDDLTYWSVKLIERVERHLNRLVWEAKIVQGKAEGIDPMQVVRAREFPIGQLIPVKRGMASCPFHKDRTPSMDTRKNFYHCYSCGAHGDVIDLAMRMNNWTFKEAINNLS